MGNKQLPLSILKTVQYGGRGRFSDVLKEIAKRIGCPSGKVYTMKTKAIKFLWNEDRVLKKKKDKEISQKDNIVVLGGRLEGCFVFAYLFSFIC